MRSPVPRRRRQRGPVPALLAGCPVVCLVGMTALSGCAAFSDGSASGEDVRVATAFYPLQFVTERVAGDLATVENLTTPGKEPHDLELTVKESAAIAQADLVVFESGFQPAVDEGVEQNATGATLDAAEVVALEPADHEGHEGHEDEDQEGEAGHDHDHEEGDDHGGLDLHFWQDPIRMATLADAVAEELAEVDPDHRDDYAANAAALREDLEELDAAYADGLTDCARDTVVVSHDAFGYLSRYGLEFEPIAGLSPDAEPTPADLGRLQALIEEDGITTVFGERLVSPRLTESLASDVGVDTAVLDPLEGLTDDTEGEDYLSLMRQNLVALKEANGCP